MKIAVKFLFIIFLYQLQILSQEKTVEFNANTNLGLTLTTNSELGTEVNLQWLFNTQVNLNYHSNNFNFDSDWFINYGQIVSKESSPVKTQDAFIFNLMPSIKIYDTPSIRLFFQSKGETQLTKGFIGEQETNFLDPLFLTQTIFLGEKNNLIKLTDNQKLELVYGLGYSFQQVIKKNFVLSSEDMQNNDVEFINSPSAVFKLNFNKNISDDISISTSLNSLFMMKKDFLKSVKNSRFSSLILASLNIKFISIQYSNRLVYDKELSDKRQLEQSLVIGFSLDL